MQPGEERVWRDRGLLRAVLAGDERAWQAWYDEAYPDLRAYVLWRCGGLRDDADEVVQEAWLTAVRRLRAFDPTQGPFVAWLRGIAANLLRNRFRRDGRRARATAPPGRREEGPADREAERREQAERVARALASLPEHYEAVLRAKYLEGRAVAEIAAERGETVKATESLLTRAREAFRAVYDDPGGAP
jgi:RNA polymerase sigma-70 factor (ECF subfamily)